MREKRFVAARRPRWERLESLIDRIDRHGLRSLAPADVDDLAFGYRAATSDLAMAQSRGYAPAITGYLNRLTARAHAYVYAGKSTGGWTKARRFVTHTFPCEVRRSWREIGACAIMTIVAAIIAASAIGRDPANAYALLPASMIPLITRSLHDSNFGFDRTFASAMATEIITNNIRVAAMAAAGGMTAGLLTVYVILINGLTVGGFGALFAHAGFGYDYWATIAPHGVIELTAIQVAGGAGLILAAGIVAPGRARRIDALVRNARRMAVLVVGAAGMLVVAGTIEGFFSPQRFPPEVRIGVGTVTALVLLSYFLFAGRTSPSATAIRAS